MVIITINKSTQVGKFITKIHIHYLEMAYMLIGYSYFEKNQ